MSTRSQAPRQASSGESSSQRQSWCPAEISQEKLLWNLHLGTWEAQRAWWILTHDHMLTGKEWKERGPEIHEDGQPRTDHWSQATLTSYRRCLVSGNQNQQYQQFLQANPPSSPSIQREENIPWNFWSWNSHRPDTTKSSDSLPSAFLSGSTRPNPQQSITCNTMIISIHTHTHIYIHTYISFHITGDVVMVSTTTNVEAPRRGTPPAWLELASLHSWKWFWGQRCDCPRNTVRMSHFWLPPSVPPHWSAGVPSEEPRNPSRPSAANRWRI